jgi:hypothetical protein
MLINSEKYFYVYILKNDDWTEMKRQKERNV